VSATSACASGGCGLIVDTHGYAMNSEMQDKYSEMRSRALPLGYVVLQGTACPGVAPNTSWEVFGYAYAARLMLQVVDELRASFRLDDGRLHATGFSEGSVMTWQLLCERPSLWASVAPTAAGSTCFGNANQSLAPAHPVPVLYQQGFHDALVPIAIGTQTISNLLRGWNVSTSGTVIDGSADYNHTRHTSSKGLVIETVYHNYFNLPIAEDPLNNWGHCFVGSPDLPASELLFGQVRHFGCPYLGKAAYSASDKIIDFFLGNRKTSRRTTVESRVAVA